MSGRNSKCLEPIPPGILACCPTPSQSPRGGHFFSAVNSTLLGAVQLDSGKQTAWHDFFSARTVNLDLLHHVPRGSRLALFLALPEGTDFWDKLGKMAPTFETELSLLLGRNVLKMAQLGLVPWPGGNVISNTALGRG